MGLLSFDSENYKPPPSEAAYLYLEGILRTQLMVGRSKTTLNSKNIVYKKNSVGTLQQTYYEMTKKMKG